MLKRCQVLLTDWMVDYLKFIAEKFHVSFSEVIRSALSIYFVDTINAMYPRAKFGIDRNERMKLIKKVLKEKKAGKELARSISAIYFEARKAVEFRMAREEKKKK